MKQKNQPAFWTPISDSDDDIQHGMALRDYFAAKAMQGFCSNPPGGFESMKSLAETAYRAADAMLAERAK
jgi:hypothetical protein